MTDQYTGGLNAGLRFIRERGECLRRRPLNEAYREPPKRALFIGGYRQYRAYVSLHRDEWAEKPMCVAGPESFRGYEPNEYAVVLTPDWARHYTRSATDELLHGLDRWEALGGTVQYWNEVSP